MTNFFKAFIVFLCWFATAYVVYNYFIYNDLATKNVAIENRSANLIIEKVYKAVKAKGYKEDIRSFKEHIAKNKITLSDLHKEFSQKGYIGSITQLEELLNIEYIDKSKIKDKAAISNLNRITNKTKTTDTPLNFTHKFITNNSHTRVLFAPNFFYFKDSIFNFLNNNPSKEITITALYTASETLPNGSTYGLARAEHLKNQLVKYGALASRILVKDSIAKYTYDNEGYYAEGIKLAYREITKQKLEQIEKELTPKSLTPYFKGNSFKPNRALTAYLFQLKHYLAKHPAKKVTVAQYAYDILKAQASKDRELTKAKTIVEYLIKNGLQKAKLTKELKAEIKPLSNNSKKKTENRRIEIIIN
ncbi:MAG: hypothetical protein ACK5H1_00730 [Tenacibaculum sp.]